MKFSENAVEKGRAPGNGVDGSFQPDVKGPWHIRPGAEVPKSCCYVAGAGAVQIPILLWGKNSDLDIRQLAWALTRGVLGCRCQGSGGRCGEHEKGCMSQKAQVSGLLLPGNKLGMR